MNATSRATWKKSDAMQVEHAHEDPPRVERRALHHGLEGQRNSRKDHGEDDQRQLDDAHDEVDLDELAGEGTEAKAADKA